VLLLLDLDGVVVLEMAPPHVENLEIVLLHEFLDEVLRDLGVPVVVLTHRSRAEANRILQSAGLTEKELTGVVAAEDIFFAALRSGSPWQLLRRGLKKSWALSVVERRYGVARERIAFIDDRLDNLEDLLAHGIGLALHVPSGIEPDGSSLVSFDFHQVVRLLKDWNGGRPVQNIVEVDPRSIEMNSWCRTGLDTRRPGRNPFNLMRRYGRWVRRVLNS
jgi:hypothetical protein